MSHIIAPRHGFYSPKRSPAIEHATAQSRARDSCMRSRMPLTIDDSAHPGCSRDDRTSNVCFPNDGIVRNVAGASRAIGQRRHHRRLVRRLAFQPLGNRVEHFRIDRADHDVAHPQQAEPDLDGAALLVRAFESSPALIRPLASGAPDRRVTAGERHARFQYGRCRASRAAPPRRGTAPSTGPSAAAGSSAARLWDCCGPALPARRHRVADVDPAAGVSLIRISRRS